MRVEFNFQHDTKLTPGQEAELATVVGAPIEKYPDDAPHYPGAVQSYKTYEGDLDRVLGILGQGARIEVHGMARPEPLAEMHRQLVDMDTRLRSTRPEPETYINNRVDVHVPGNSLLAITTVMVAVDLCSDALQDYLTDGWRIVAVCPQPDQRRPDYVLGRRDEDA